MSFDSRMKFDIYKWQNKYRVLKSAEWEFIKTVEGGKSQQEINEMFDRLYQESVRWKEEWMKLWDNSHEVTTRSLKSTSWSWSKTPLRKIGKKEAMEIYRWFITSNVQTK